MNFQKKLPVEVATILQDKKLMWIDYDYYAIPYTFGSTSGPKKGIGGCAMSYFTVEAYEFEGETYFTVYVCSDTYYFSEDRYNPNISIKDWIPFSSLRRSNETI
jgi:hypothetical protein